MRIMPMMMLELREPLLVLLLLFRREWMKRRSSKRCRPQRRCDDVKLP